ncbi:type II toxin-antitoxin system VapC family toxin [Propioniferax innocua]|uniref:PIN domain-containing protein n=1 Tax=Propioniferax innocua TaxID=1753 RepID=A0A542ZT05_9ACTN|nr:type II toxin-antitoxin system VapC family toxin [Propioniferax innocua]TQL63437.1 hypothetical protein FB460_1249 [Propioniferax innocua]
MNVALDTNVISELTKAHPDPNVVTWIGRYRSAELFLPAPCLAELHRGLLLMPPGRRREALTTHVDRLLTGLGGVLAFSANEARVFARLTSQPGRPRPTTDAMIAAICFTHEMPLATRNTSDFSDCDIELIDPWAPRE